MLTMGKIKNSVFVVTGGSSGLGKSTCELLLSEGARITIIDLIDPKNEIFDESRGLFIQGDVCSESDVQSALKATKAKFGRIDGLVHCAGIFRALGDEIFNLKTMKPGNLTDITDVIHINLIGTFNTNRLVIPYFLENEGDEEGQKGLIINCSSPSGRSPIASGLAYSISKVGTMALSLPLAKQLSTVGIRVMDIAGGLCETPMYRNAVESNSHMASLKNNFPSRLIRPEEFAKTVKYVIETPMINGSSLYLDGALLPSQVNN